jgi:uncharacterized OB-fold protein
MTATRTPAARSKGAGAPKLVPLREGMFKMPRSMNGKPRLLGQRCTSCGEQFSNQREFCANCCEPTLENVMFGTTGEITTYTTVRQQLPGALIEAPYVIARVCLDEGVSVQTILSEIEPDEVEIGMKVVSCLKQVMEDDNGNAVVNTFFKPASKRRKARA